MITQEQFLSLKVGDRIKFRASTRFGTRTHTRIIKSFFGTKRCPEVKANGSDGFIVHHHEIIEIVK